MRRTDRRGETLESAEIAVGVLDTVLVKVQPHLPSNMVAEHSSIAVDVPIPQIHKEIWVVIQRILRERIPKHVVEQIVDVAKAMPNERLQQRTAGQIVKMTVAELMDEIAEVVKIVLHERVRHHFAQQAVDVPGRQIVEGTIEGVKVVCPERVPERTAEQVDVPVSQDVEQTTGIPVLVNGGRVTVSWRRCRVR